jgi:outer membrane protein
MYLILTTEHMTSPEKDIAVMQCRINLKMQERKISLHFVLFLSFFFLWMATKAQDSKIWTLEDCINYALDNNISIKKQDLLIKTQEELLLQSKLGILPNLNGYASHGYNWGQRVDPFTNDFATDKVRSNNLYLQGDLNLFSGLQQLNLIKRNMLNMQSAQLDADYYRDEIAVTVATQYLQTLFYIEFVAMAKNQIDITHQQVERTRKLVDAGTLAKGDLLTIEAQLASEELSIVEAENDLSLSNLNLTQLLEIPTPKGFEIERPEVGLMDQPEILTPEQIFGVAVKERPEIQSAEIKLESSERSLSLARGAYYPSLSLNGSLGSGYSGANQIGSNPYSFIPQIGVTEGG